MTDSTRMPLGDLTSSSNVLQNEVDTVESKPSSQILIDLSNEYIPVKTVSEMKISIETKSKIGIIKPKPPVRQRAPAAKKGTQKLKKTKIDIEFEKLTASEQLSFLQSKATLLQNLEMTATSKDELEVHGNDKVIEAAGNASGELCSLRLELGAVLSSEAELRAKERKLRLMIKRVQRKMIMDQSPLVCRRREEVPSNRVVDNIFPSGGGSSSFEREQAFRDACNGDRKEDGLWCLAQQTCGFEARVVPRLLDEQRDATLCSGDLPAASTTVPTATTSITASATVSVAAFPTAAVSTTTASTTAASANTTTPAVEAHLSSPSKESVSSISSKAKQEAAITLPTAVEQQLSTTEALTATTTTTAAAGLVVSVSAVQSSDVMDFGSFGGDPGSLEVDIYDPCDDSSSAGEEATEEQVTATRVDAMAAELALPEQGLAAGKRAGVFQQYAYSAENCVLEESHPIFKKPKSTALEASLAVPAAAVDAIAETLPTCSGKPATTAAAVFYPMFSQEQVHSVELIDLTSPEAAGAAAFEAPVHDTAGIGAVPPAHVLGASIDGKSTAPMEAILAATATAPTHSTAVDIGDTNNVKEDESTPESCFDAAVIHYRPPGYVSQDSQQDSAGSSTDTPAVGRRKVQQESQLSSSTDSSGPAAPCCTVNSESAAATAVTCNNLLSSAEQPDFTALPVQRLREVVGHYGLRVDSKHKMVSLLQAMWQRLHQ